MVAFAEPDWESLAVDPGDPDTTRAVSRFLRTDIVRNAVIGRQLTRLATAAGLEVRSVTPVVPVFHDFADADRVFGLTRNADRAVKAGKLDREAAREWLTTLTTGPFQAAVVLYTVVVESPA